MAKQSQTVPVGRYTVVGEKVRAYLAGVREVWIPIPGAPHFDVKTRCNRADLLRAIEREASYVMFEVYIDSCDAYPNEPGATRYAEVKPA